MFENFDIDNIEKEKYLVGKLTEDINCLLELNLGEKLIYISNDKIEYTQKHSHKFNSYNEYKTCIESTPSIVQYPDYVAVHPTGQSIEFIKRINEIMLVAVRIKPHGNLWVKSVFPITEAKLNKYIDSGTVKKLK